MRIPTLADIETAPFGCQRTSAQPAVIEAAVAWAKARAKVDAIEEEHGSGSDAFAEAECAFRLTEDALRKAVDALSLHR